MVPGLDPDPHAKPAQAMLMVNSMHEQIVIAVTGSDGLSIIT